MIRTAITKFDRQVCKAAEPEILAALEVVAQRYGLTVKGNGGNYSDTEWICKVQFAITKTADGKSKEQADFERMCNLFYCEKSDYGRTLTVNHEECALIGFALSRPKFPIRVRRKSDGVVRLTTSEILRKIGRQAPWEKDEQAI